MKYLLFRIIILLASPVAVMGAEAASTVPASLIDDFERQWEQVYYHADAHHKARALRNLADRIEDAARTYRRAGVLYVAEAVALCSYAESAGPLSALSAVKKARRLLERALSLEMTDAERAEAHVVLGALYYMVPGWPVGFGDRAQARRHLEAALRLSPDSRAAHYFYGDFLWEQGQREQALTHFLKVVSGPASRSIAERAIRKKALARVKTADRWLVAYRNAR